ncbi:hypothetical protein AB4Z14_16545, partial [Terrabacter sp. 2TAF16]
LLALCTFHHDGHHRGEFTLTGDPTHPDGLTFHTDTGLLIGPPQKPPPPPPPPTPPPQPRLTPAPDPNQPDRSDGSDRSDESDGADGAHAPDRRRPPARLGRRYPAPSGGTLHLHLVDFTPT